MASLVSQWKLDNSYADSNGINDLVEGGSGNSFSTSILKRGTHSLQLNGSGYAAKAGPSGHDTGNADRSMGGWFYASNANAVEGIMAIGSDLNSQGFTIIKLSTTSIRIDLRADALSFTVPAMSNNTWYWVWAVYSQGNKSSRLYLNNVESSSGLQAHSANSNLGTDQVVLGLDVSLTNNFTGNFDDMRFYNGILTAAEREQVFNSFKPRGFFF